MIFDKDRDSTISHQEFRKVMKGLGQHISEKQLKLMFQQIDTDGKYIICCLLKMKLPFSVSKMD